MLLHPMSGRRPTPGLTRAPFPAAAPELLMDGKLTKAADCYSAFLASLSCTHTHHRRTPTVY